MSKTAGELSQRQSRQCGAKCGAEWLPRRVGVGECAALHGLRGRCHGETFPVPHLDQRVEELAARVDRVEDLLFGAPPLARSLLEQTDRVGVPVVKVLQ